jgi:methionyl-tRNA formyltransferase
MTQVVLLTGDAPRHRYAAAMVAAALDLRGVLIERKASPTAHLEAGGDDARVVREHLARNSAVEARVLGHSHELPSHVDVRMIHQGGANDADVCQWVNALAPDIVLLFGSSIIRAPLLTCYDNRIINLHLGLSPYYRGSGTNFWPLVDGMPECVGATVHLATSRVDGGAVLAQTRPHDVAADDGPADIGIKAIVAGIALWRDVTSPFVDGRIAATPQRRGEGKLCRRADVNAEAVRVAHRNVANGMMGTYLSAKAARDARYPIIAAEVA